MFDVRQDTLDSGVVYNNVEYKVVEILEDSLVLCVLATEAAAGNFPLQTYVLPAPWKKN